MAEPLPHHTTPRGGSARPAGALGIHRLLLAFALIVPALPAAAHADSIKLSGFWHDNVAIESVVDGQLVYRTAGGRRTERALAVVEGLKLDRYPALGEAEEAREAGEHAQAADRYRAVLAEAETESRDAWVAHYIRGRLVETLDALGEGAEAVRMYVALFEGRSEGQPDLLIEPPLTSAQRVAPEQQRELAATLDEALADMDEAMAEQLEPLRAVLREPAADAGAGAQVEEAEMADSAVVLPAGIDDDEATQHLRNGDFESALEAAQRTLDSSGGLSRGLYQKAAAQLAQAEAANDPSGRETQLKTAGLNFMRVVVYFPRSRYVGPALVEAGYVHARIGRPDVAVRLYERAALRIDEERDPAYHQRLTELRQRLADDES